MLRDVVAVFVAGLFCVFAMTFVSQVQAAGEEKPTSLAVGQVAPGFALADSTGKIVKLSDYAGKIVVLEWVNPECPFVQRHYKAGTFVNLSAKYADKGVVWLAINSTSHATAADNQKWIEQYKLSFPILSDTDGAVGHAYFARTTPELYIINTDGKIAYLGAIDDDAQGDKSSPTNYVTQALDEVLAGKAVTTPQTRSYGCSVKYKS